MHERRSARVAEWVEIADRIHTDASIGQRSIVADLVRIQTDIVHQRFAQSRHEHRDRALGEPGKRVCRPRTPETEGDVELASLGLEAEDGVRVCWGGQEREPAGGAARDGYRRSARPLGST